MAGTGRHPWKTTAIGTGLAVAVTMVAGVVVTSWPESAPAHDAAARVVASVAAPAQPSVPSPVAVDACNRLAASESSQAGTTVEIVKVGARGGSLYGVNEHRKTEPRYRDAYARCMLSRGYAS